MLIPKRFDLHLGEYSLSLHNPNLQNKLFAIILKSDIEFTGFILCVLREKGGKETGAATQI